MSNEKTDRRTKYTRMVLRQSLLELMKENPIGKISVTDICRLADINRGTFYTHYNDPYDLLQQIQDELFEGIGKALGRLKPTDMSEPATMYSVTPEIFLRVAENSDICSILLGKHGDAEFIREIIYLAKGPSIDTWVKLTGRRDKKLFEYLFNFIANGSVSLIQLWIQNGLKETPHEMATMVNNMANSCVRSFLQ